MRMFQIIWQNWKFIWILGKYQNSPILSDFEKVKFIWQKMFHSCAMLNRDPTSCCCRLCRNTTISLRYRWDSCHYSNTYFQKETYHQMDQSWQSMFVFCVHHFRDLIEVCRSMHILPNEICFSMYEQRHILWSSLYVTYFKILTICTIRCIKILIARPMDILGPYFDIHTTFYIT